MAECGFSSWDGLSWGAYGSLFISCIIIAADVGIKMSDELKPRFESLLKSKLWAFSPLFLVLLATAILLYKGFSPSNYSDLLEQNQKLTSQTISDKKQITQLLQTLTEVNSRAPISSDCHSPMGCGNIANGNGRDGFHYEAPFSTEANQNVEGNHNSITYGGGIAVQTLNIDKQSYNLSDQDRKAFISVLAKNPMQKTPIGFQATSGNSDFMNQVAAALINAGWSPGEQSIIFSSLPKGITIVSKTGQLKDVQILSMAFKIAGFSPQIAVDKNMADTEITVDLGAPDQ